MGCGCSKSQNNSQVTTLSSTEPNPDCSYTAEQLNQFKTTLYCIKNQELFNQTNSTEGQINSYLGTVISATYYPSNYCHFQNMLDQISEFLSTVSISNCN